MQRQIPLTFSLELQFSLVTLAALKLNVQSPQLKASFGSKALLRNCGPTLSQALRSSGLLFGLCGIISRDGPLSASRRSAWPARSGTQSGTFAAFYAVELCDAVGAGSTAESAVLRRKAIFRGHCGRADSRGRPVDRRRSAGCWLASWTGRRGLPRARPRCSTR